MNKGGCCPIPSLYSDEGHETLAETLTTIKTLVVVVNARLEKITDICSINMTQFVTVVHRNVLLYLFEKKNKH